MSTHSTARLRLVAAKRDLGGLRFRDYLLLLPAVLLSMAFHGALIPLFLTLSTPAELGGTPQTESAKNDKAEEKEVARMKIKEDAPEKIKPQEDPLQVTSIGDPLKLNPTQDLGYKDMPIKEVSVPGVDLPEDPIGILNGNKDNTARDIPPPKGFGGGQGGDLMSEMLPNTSSNPLGSAGGHGLDASKLDFGGSFYGRSGATKLKVLFDGGGTTESEAAVARGITWLVRQQRSDGSWSLKGDYPDKPVNDRVIAATSFGLLPLLGAGYTHFKSKNSESNPWAKNIEAGLYYLVKKQDKKSGNFGGNLYDHGLATIAICEAYGLTQDPYLKYPAQMAVNYIIHAQHKSGGGWRYKPGEAGDMSVTGWQVMALKSARMAGLMVPDSSFAAAIRFCESCSDSRQGYGYTGPGATPAMSAVGLLCRQYLESWNAKNSRLIAGVENHLMTHQPQLGLKNMYYYYYATQVVHHFGHDQWKNWNGKMQPMLLGLQDKSNSKLHGSWSSQGWEGHADAGGRLMQTSLILLTLEVYYRHLPLYYREMGEKRQQLFTGS